MKRPKKRPSAVQRTLGSIKSQFLSDVKGFAAGLKDPLNYKDPSPERTAKSKKAVEDLRKSSNKRSPKKDPVADAAAARIAKTKAEGRKRRVKFEKAQGEKAKKRRALLLNIQKAKK